jgi:hypothetical protein
VNPAQDVTALLAVIDALPPIPPGDCYYPAAMMDNVARHARLLSEYGWDDDGSVNEAVLSWMPGDAELWRQICEEERNPPPYVPPEPGELDYEDYLAHQDAEPDTDPIGTSWARVVYCAGSFYGADTSRWQTPAEWAETKEHYAALVVERAASATKAAARTKTKAATEAAKGDVRVFKPTALSEMAEAPTMEWTVGGLVPAGAMTFTYGAQKNFKSFLAISMGLHVAAGRPFAGMPVDEGAVFYLAAEAPGSVMKRAEAARRHYMMAPDIPFHVLNRLPKLSDDKQMAQLAADLKITACGEPVKLVIIDTWAKAMKGSDESNTGHASIAVDACETLAQALGCAIMPVHHSGKDGKLRGSNAPPAAAASVNRITRAGGYATWTNEDLRDGAEIAPLCFELVAADDTLVAVHRPDMTAKDVKGKRGTANAARAARAGQGDAGKETDPEPAQASLATAHEADTAILSFVGARCVVGDGQVVAKSALANDWATWAKAAGVDPGTEATFGRRLKATLPALGEDRPRVDGKRLTQHTGIGLR